MLRPDLDHLVAQNRLSSRVTLGRLHSTGLVRRLGRFQLGGTSDEAGHRVLGGGRPCRRLVGHLDRDLVRSLASTELAPRLRRSSAEARLGWRRLRWHGDVRHALVDPATELRVRRSRAVVSAPCNASHSGLCTLPEEQWQVPQHDGAAPGCIDMSSGSSPSPSVNVSRPQAEHGANRARRGASPATRGGTRTSSLAGHVTSPEPVAAPAARSLPRTRPSATSSRFGPRHWAPASASAAERPTPQMRS